MLRQEYCRRIEVWFQGKMWVPVQMQQLEKGDIIRMFEGNGSPVITAEGDAVFICAGNATVSCDPYKEALTKSPLV